MAIEHDQQRAAQGQDIAGKAARALLALGGLVRRAEV